MIDTETPGEPKPPAGERPEDIVDVAGMNPVARGILLRAAEVAIAKKIEPGIRRARWIDGYVHGFRETHQWKLANPRVAFNFNVTGLAAVAIILALGVVVGMFVQWVRTPP